MPSRKKITTVIGVFESRARADQAVSDLKAAGFTDDQIGMVVRDANGRPVRTKGDDTYAEEGAIAGAAAGAGAGALIGAGVLAGVVPIIGPVLAIGTLGTILLNAAGGAALAGITGALIGWGIPEEDAEYYEGEVKAGRFLVTVQAGNRADEARTVLHRFGGFDRTTRPTEASETTAATVKKTASRSRTARPAAGIAAGDGSRTIQLREERVKARKTPVKAGEVEVRKEVTTERKTVNVPVEREEVVIERRPVGGRATAADFRAEEVRIPVTKEKAEVRKETVATEEVSVGKRKVRDTETVAADVRKEELVVETEGKARSRQTGRKK